MKTLKLPYLYHTDKVLNTLTYNDISTYINKTNAYILNKILDFKRISNEEQRLLDLIDELVDCYKLLGRFNNRTLSLFFFYLTNYMLSESR